MTRFAGVTECDHEPAVLAADFSVQAIVCVRVAPSVRHEAFEWWLRTIRQVLSATLVTGDVDYELRLDCSSFEGLADALARIRSYTGTEVASVALVLHEVEGLGQRVQRAPNKAMVHRLRGA
jgi:hypothetical protein